ncbi:MAG: gliding motility lipoprotein GldH [Marinilabiliaceae bacterium]|nr:gliding motility lipoprotein GldH [Marinilabiliaceae bacterium]
MMKKFILFIASVTMLLTACNQRDVYNEYIALPDNGWNMDSLAVFRAEIDDTVSYYDIWVQMRHQSNYPYANLWLFIDLVSPDGDMVRDTLECFIAEPDGTWYGAGWGSLYSVRCPYRMHNRFRLPGCYTFRLTQGMRADEVQGIHSIGLRIFHSEQDGEK